MAAQGEDSAAGPAHVAEQCLQDRRGTDVLHADGVLSPAQTVDERGGAVAAGIGRDQLAHLGEQVAWDAAGLFDHLRGVAGEVPLQHLEHAPRMLQRVVGVRAGVGGGPAGAVGFAAS